MKKKVVYNTVGSVVKSFKNICVVTETKKKDVTGNGFLRVSN